MAKSFRRDDGKVIRAETDDDLVRQAEAYIRAAHPHLAGQLSRQQLLELAVDAPPNDMERENEP